MFFVVLAYNKNMVAELYRKILPEKVRLFIYNTFLGKLLFFIRNRSVITNSKLHYWFRWVLPKSEKNTAYAFVGKHGLTSYCGNYLLDYSNASVDVQTDEETGMPFVLHNQKKLYFRRSSDKKKIQEDYKALLIEQDIRCAHRYVVSYEELAGRILLDIGCAEASFALDVVDKVEKIYLFEYDPEWEEALKLTFSSWPDRVEIIRKYVSDTNNNNHITIDTFMDKRKKQGLFLKMDIEGYERKALTGAKKLLEEAKDIKMAICVYHQKNDPEFFSELLTDKGFSCSFSNGYMIWGNKISRGVIRSVK